MHHTARITWVLLATLLLGACVARSQTEQQLPLGAAVPDDYRNATLWLRLEGIRPLDGQPADLVVRLERRDGQWAQTGHSVVANYNEVSQNEIEIVQADYDDARVQGRLRVTIGPDGARRGRAHFPTPPDQFVIDFEAQIHDEPLPYQPDREAFMPPWRKEVPQFGGRRIAGQYTAQWTSTGEPQQRQGQIVGALAYAAAPGQWGTQGNVLIARDEQALRIFAQLPPTRVAAGFDAWATYRLPEPRDFSEWDGLAVTIRSPQRRDDAAVGVAIRQAGGGSYAVRDVVAIREGESRGIVAFSDFGYGWSRPDPSRIDQIQVGVSNPHGVGDVQFTVTGLELVRIPGVRRPGGEVVLEVDPRVVISVNGAQEVPKGLFGYHGFAHNRAPRPQEGRLDPLEHYAALNGGFARQIIHTGFNARELTDEQIAERQAQRRDRTEPGENNWLHHRARAGNMEDHVMMCHTQDLWARPGWMDQGVEPWKDRLRAFYRNEAANAWTPGDDFNPVRLLQVWNEPFMWGRHINMGFRNPPGARAWEDPTQYGYIPGAVGADAYSEMFLAAAEGARSANPHVLIGGPASAAFSGDDFGVLQNYAGRIIDRIIEQADFISEHHYGGNPLAAAAAYEVTTAWMDVRHNRRIPIYNTETGDLGASNAGKAAYNIADILSVIRWAHDKSPGRALHYFGGDYMANEGEEHAYLLMAPLRGRVLASRTSDEDILLVASTPEPGRVVLLAMNNSPRQRPVRVVVPEGFTMESARILLADAPEGELQIHDVDGAYVPKPAEGSTSLHDLDAASAGALELPARSAVRWTLTREGYEPTRVRQFTQHYADVVLGEVQPDRPLQATVLWREEFSERPRTAVLRLVTRGVGRREGEVRINGRPVPLRQSISNDQGDLIQEIPIDPSWLAPRTVLEFRCVDPERATGFSVRSASVLVEARAANQ